MNIMDIEIEPIRAAISSYVTPEWTTAAALTATAITTAIVTVITTKSYFVSRLQVRHELFLKRFLIYKEFTKFRDKLHFEQYIKMDDVLALNSAIDQSRFLFGNEVHKRLDTVWDHAWNLQIADGRSNQNTIAGKNDQQLDEKIDHERTWLTRELKSIHEVFMPYMSFSNK